MSNSSNIFLKFSENYASIHGQIVFPLTILGILTSVVTMKILNQKSFQTVTNLILGHIALFDTMVLISFNIYSFYFYILHDPNPFVGQSSFWPWFAIFHSHIGLTAHSIALWLTCLLAIIRYTIISKPNQIVIKFAHIKLWICLIGLLVCVLMIPSYLSWNVINVPAHSLLSKYSVNSSERVYWTSPPSGKKLEKISFGIVAICLKISPVFILIIFSILLILNIRHADQLRENLRRHCSSMNSHANLKREIRTTRMLVLITLCTVFVELPQGFVLILIGMNNDYFAFYSHLGDFWDITSISSSFITFVMYCSMSQQFRMEILGLILPKYFIQKWNFKTKEQNDCKSNIQLKQINQQNSSLIVQN